jgi:hypothetical protein
VKVSFDFPILLFLPFLSRFHPHTNSFALRDDEEEEEEEMEQLQLLLLSSPSLQPPSDEIVQKCTLVSEHKDLDSLGRGRESGGGVDAGGESGGGLSTSERENLRAFRAGFLSSLRKVREIIVASNSIEKGEIGAVRFMDDEEDEDEREKELVVSTSGVKKKVLIEVIGDDEEKSPRNKKKNKKKQCQMWNDFALLLCGMMETSDGIPSWASKECSDLAREI